MTDSSRDSTTEEVYSPAPQADSYDSVDASIVGAAPAGEAPLRQASLWGDAWGELRKNPLFIISAVIVLVFAVMAVAPGLFTSADPYECDLSRSVQSPSREHIFGYDIQGCDYYAQVVHGARISMQIGLLVVLVAGVIAVVLGSLAAYYGGILDTLIARMADIVFAIPTILGGIVILSALGDRGLGQVSAVLILLGWPTTMRLMRSTVLSVKHTDYVQAARALGARDVRIMLTHIFPNALAPVLVYGTIYVGIIIAAEAALSFLGVGLQLPEISWGLMINSAQSRVLLTPHLLLFPAAFLSIVVLSFIVMGDALRDALDPKLR